MIFVQGVISIVFERVKNSHFSNYEENGCVRDTLM